MIKVTVSDLRANLSRYLTLAESEPVAINGRPVALARHAENVVEVPRWMLDSLISGFIRESANHELHSMKALGRPRTTGTPLPPGDPMGKLVAWLWQADQKCAFWMSVYMAELRFHGVGADPSIELEEVLSGLRFALPSAVEDDERERIIEHLRVNVPRY